MADRRLTDLELERWLADDLPEARRGAASDADRRRLDELRAEHAALLGAVDVGAELRAIEQRIARAAPPPRRFARWTWLASGGALAAAAAVALLVVLRPGGGPDDGPIYKGDIALQVYAADASGSHRLDAGATVQPGDKIRFGVHVAARGYVAVVGIDGSGAATAYYPFGSREPAAIAPGGDAVLPGAIALDAAPGDERFYAVFAERPFAIDAALFAGLRGEHTLAGLTIAEVVLHKKTSRF
ncbi:MAG: DUF4384 domain-containing protein [Deltaproteobacteria bacterium]|nr:MAG: DUF4384 domain-containing protein [Deltaproteobacteria bacterium]TMQ11436.1 MAG: DUF4384 domain-containing protein [Deltaproteobacteria bacterium]